ncbi:MAG: hypothetical protein RQ761_10975 [Bacteroidales bacterium]|nr:hypothetical protein [Bacteroidales bacterium]
MNLSKSIKLIAILIMATLVVAACKKDEPEEIPTNSAPVQQLSTDDKSVEDNVDEVIIDATNVLSGNHNLKNMGLPCNAHLDTVYTHNDTIHYHIIYNGLNCIQNKHRQGMVVLKLRQNTQWYLPGSFMIVEFHNYHVTHVFNGKSVLLNGMASLENISGGIIQLLGSGFNSVIHRNRAHFRVSFNGQIPREWQLAKMLVYSGSPGNLMMAVNGYGIAAGYENLLSWGKDRDGKDFYVQVSESVTFREGCNWVPSSGEQVYSLPADNLKATATFGFNHQNKPVMGNDCPTRYRLRWQQHGHSGTIFLPLGGNQ